MRQHLQTVLSRGKITFILAVIFPVLVAYNAIFRPWPIHPERAFFLGAILALTIFLVPIKTKSAVSSKIYFIIDLILIVAVIASAVHIILDWEYIILFMGAPRTIDILLGITAVLVTLEATRRTMFPLVPVCLAFLLYAVFGQHLIGGILAPPSVSIDRLVHQLYLTTLGLYGLVLNVALKYIVPFLIMGCMLKAMGAMDVLNDLVTILVGRTVGGPAKIAVVTSSMFGMVSGSATANVAFTGTFTIPLMKKYGYKPEFAGGVEAAASTGGQLMPPIMGVAAFIMADYTGIPYLRIMLAGILPALLYYLAIFLRVHYGAKHRGLVRPAADIAGRVATFRQIIPRLIPLVVVFIVLVTGLFLWTPTRAALVTTGIIIPLSFLRHETRLTPMKLLAGLKEATYSFLPIGAACIAIGILMAVALQTGLGLKFSELMIIASGESLLLLLIVTAVACLIMGMGIAGVAVYIFAGIMLGPALVGLGLPILVAHFFIFYFAQLQSITPPVCLASYTAASIAKANPTRTALNGVMVGLVGFVGAFLFVFHQELLLIGNIGSILITFLLMATAVVALNFMIEGYASWKLSLWERLLFGLSAFVIFVSPNYGISLVGVVIGLLTYFSKALRRRKGG